MAQSNVLDLFSRNSSKRKRTDWEVVDLTGEKNNDSLDNDGNNEGDGSTVGQDHDDKSVSKQIKMESMDELTEIKKELGDAFEFKQESEPEKEEAEEIVEQEHQSDGDDELPAYIPELGPFEDEIPCPVCLLNIQKLSLNERESHVELCLLQPRTHKFIVTKSPKKPKQKTTKPTKPPKEPKPPKPRTRPIPDFKILTFKNNYKVNVDGFLYMDHPDVDKYFLSHFHSDHYGGLGKNWEQGVIYTSKTTSNLLQAVMKIPEERIIPVPFNEKFKITDDIDVTLYDANHCPGGAIFLFQEYNKEGEVIKRILHTGDFRVSQIHLNIFKDIYIDEIYLDTTYMNPVYTFMPQTHLVQKTSSFISEIVDEGSIKKNSILNYFNTKNSQSYFIIIGSYSIGKEKLYINLAKKINSKILISKDRYKMLSCIDGFKDLDIFTTDESDMQAKVQIVPLMKLSDMKFLSKFSNKKIIKIKPTGWSYNTFQTSSKLIRSLTQEQLLARVLNEQEQSTDQFKNQLLNQFQKSSTLRIPYSEHSSFKELCVFGCYLKWGKMIPTVNTERGAIFQTWFDLWRETKINYDVIDDYYNPK